MGGRLRLPARLHRRALAEGFAIFVLVLPGASACRGQDSPETTFQVANQFEFYYDTDLRESVMDDRMDVLASRGPYRLGVTLLSHSPSNEAALDPNNYGRQRQGIRKRWFEASVDEYAARVGTVYGTHGRGLALSIFEDQIVDFDNALDGFAGRASRGPLTVDVIGGTNAFGPAALTLKAARVGVGLPAGFQAAAEGTWADYQEGPKDAEVRTGGDRLYGGLLQGTILGRVDAYGEYVVRDNRDNNGDAGPLAQGHAGYASASFGVGPLQVLGEFKDLLRYDLPQYAREDGTLVPFVSPPTAVRQHATTLLNRATHVSRIRPEDERGGIVEAYLGVGENTRLTGSFSSSRARHRAAGSVFQPPDLPPGVLQGTDFRAWEAYGEVEQHFPGEIEVILRVAESEEEIEEGGVPFFFERITAAVSVVAPLNETWSIDTTVETQSTQENLMARVPEFYEQEDFPTTVATLTVSRAPNMSWALTGEWTGDDREPRKSWLWGEWNYRVSDRNQLVLAGGRLRGGQVCSGGVCRLVDPFEGVRIEVLTTF